MVTTAHGNLKFRDLFTPEGPSYLRAWLFEKKLMVRRFVYYETIARTQYLFCPHKHRITTRTELAEKFRALRARIDRRALSSP